MTDLMGLKPELYRTKYWLYLILPVPNTALYKVYSSRPYNHPDGSGWSEDTRGTDSGVLYTRQQALRYLAAYQHREFRLEKVDKLTALVVYQLITE